MGLQENLDCHSPISIWAQALRSPIDCGKKTPKPSDWKKIQLRYFHRSISEARGVSGLNCAKVFEGWTPDKAQSSEGVSVSMATVRQDEQQEREKAQPACLKMACMKPILPRNTLYCTFLWRRGLWAHRSRAGGSLVFTAQSTMTLRHSLLSYLYTWDNFLI